MVPYSQRYPHGIRRLGEDMAREIPTWLDGAPEGEVPHAPVVTRSQGLPFNELTWQNYERLILRVVRRDARILDCVLYGTPGQAQEGIDVLATRNIEPTRQTCYQCKRVVTFDPVDIRKAVDKFLSGPFADTAKEFVLCVSIPLEGTAQISELGTQRDRLHQRGIAFVKWDGSEGGDLCEKLKYLPELVDDFFGRPWVEEFNGKEAASRLGDRLDAVDLGKLRSRLSQLYTVLFNQHDPGPLTTTGHSADFRYRYVPADIVEAVSSTPSHANDATASTTSASEVQSTSNSSDGSLPVQLHHKADKGEELSTFETRRQLTSWLKGQQNCVVLGEPGYGKSAMLRHLAISLLQQDDALAGHLDPQQLRRLPAWMSFAAFAAAIELNKGTSVEDFFSDWLHRYGFEDVGELFKRSLRNSEVLLLVDGLDEAVSLGHARIALDRLVTFAQAKGAAVLCTSRPRGFSALGTPRTWVSAHLAPFSDTQIHELSARWFALSDDDTSSAERFANALHRARPRGETFLAAVRANARTHQLARTPLLCQTLIELFRKSPRLPEERVVVYGEIVSLLLSRHPGSRARAADETSPVEYGELSASDIRKVLIRLALTMQSSGPAVVASTALCEAVCADYLEDELEGLGRRKAEARRQAQTTVSDLVTRFGVLVERAPQELGFVHLSIQEYLAAEAKTGLPDSEQLEWISSVWLTPAWRECLVNWFGLNGSRGKKVFAGQAAARIVELGSAGEFERMQALQLCTDLACSDLGIPVSDARRIVHGAAVDVEQSPFVQHRMALARSLTIGALGSSVSDECSAFVQRWTPGRSSHARAACITELGKWKAADDLKALLMRGMLDEDGQCRRASSQSLVVAFADDDGVLLSLRKLALHHVRPEVRATAVRALGLRANWVSEALFCANANLSTANAELLFEAVKIRVRQHEHCNDDLERVSRLWANEAVDFWLREEFTEVLLEGWPKAPKIREAFIAQTRGRTGFRMDAEEQLVYLMRAYPGDDDVAKLLAEGFRERGLQLSMNGSRLWSSMRDGFRSHATLAPAVRDALSKYKEEHERIFWHPNEIGAYMVLGDEAARDELIAAYGSTEHEHGRYWIARTLSDGWPDDAIVLAAMKLWAGGTIGFSAPLSEWSVALYDVSSERRMWLERLATDCKSSIAARALGQLINQFPDRRALDLVRDRLKGIGIWYYDRVRLESKIAATFPTLPKSLETFERSLRELDGPPIAPWVVSAEKIPSLRTRVLVASVSAPADVRMAIASTMQERMADRASVTRLNPNYLADANGAIRATVMTGLAQGCKGESSQKTELADLFTAELMSSGTYFSSRRRCGLASLLEMNAAQLAAEKLELSNSSSWTSFLVDRLDADPVSLGAIIRHWHLLEPHLKARGLSFMLPLNDIVSAGYGAMLAQAPELHELIEEYLRSTPPEWVQFSFFELLGRKYPSSDLLCTTLVEDLQRRQDPAVARLLARHFGGEPDVWEKIRASLSGLVGWRHGFADGFLGFLACGWRDQPTRAEIDALLPVDKAAWGECDRLLISVANGDKVGAENAAKEILSEPLINWSYRVEGTEALREWAKDPIALEVLLRWSKSEDSTLSMTSIALMNDRQARSSLDLDALRTKFNEHCRQAVIPPDGLDAVARRTGGWCTATYSGLVSEISL